MVHPRFRSAVTPLRRARAAAPTSVDALIAALRPEEPVHCLRPQVIAEAAAGFVAGFPGDVLYAVKCNPDPAVLRAVWAGGVRHFDCASAAEVSLVRQMFPEADIHFMHPVKARSAIRDAYASHGVRDFVLDSAGELAKILAETGSPDDLGLFVRLALPPGGAVYDLSGKFGAAPDEAAALLRAVRPHAARVGLCFHVGSQCMEPQAWRTALALAGQVIAASGVAVDVVDVGGGFPVRYPDLTPPPVGDFMAAIAEGFAALDLPGTRLWAEPGRALVAAGGSVVVQVQARRGDALYLNDGVYGSLSDAGAPGFRFPVRPLRRGTAAQQEFTLFGPTCDSVDRLRHSMALPADIAEGDWIEIGQLGAYGACLRTGFNGFDRARIAEVVDRPLLEAAPAAVARAA